MKNILRALFYYTHYPLLLLLKKSKVDKKLFKNKNYIIASNHASILDPVLLTMFFYHKYSIWVRFLSADKNYKNPFMRAYLYAFDSVRIADKDKASAIEISADLLKKGDNVGIFPEGKCIVGKTCEVKTGVVRLAIDSGYEILPVRICGTEKILPPGKTIPRLRKSEILLGKPIKVHLSDTNPSYNRLKSTSKDVMNRIYSLKKHER